jgi:hypothetical protein
LSFEERLGLLADCELTERDSRRLALRLRSARLRESAAIEDLDTRAARVSMIIETRAGMIT